jgi:hypothetical protein
LEALLPFLVNAGDEREGKAAFGVTVTKSERAEVVRAYEGGKNDMSHPELFCLYISGK